MGKRHKKQGSKNKGHRRSLCDRHHFFFREGEWKKEESFWELRVLPYCIAHLPVGIHRLIHSQIDRVPLPKQSSVEQVLISLRECGAINKKGSAVDRLGLLADYFCDHGDSPTARVLKAAGEPYPQTTPHKTTLTGGFNILRCFYSIMCA